MSNKSKGSKYERELCQIFVDNFYRAVRVAGSGVMENSDCDLIAGKDGKKYCVEVKSSKKTSIYISKEQIENFMIFSEIFKLEPVLALRFNREGWIFIRPNNLKDSGKNWVISLEDAKNIGKKFSQFFE